MTQILLGFEVGTGEAVYMQLKHTVALGMTQAGKTTTLEAIISRTPNVKALAFKTKRGEAGFSSYNDTPLYYKSRADWQYLEGLLNTALREKVQYQPFMRWAIMQVTKGAPRSLRQVMQKAHAMQEDKRFSRRKEVFEILETYLQLVVPELEKYTFTDKLEIKAGINVMDISTMQTETQYLIIAACIEYIHDHMENVICIVPEAWEALPQGRITPVKLAAEKYIRKGAAIGNLLFLDSQDIAGIDKQPLRQCDNWIMGRMKETNEVDRLKEYLPKNVRFDSAEDFRTLPLGQFFAVLGNITKKVYVLPAGVPEEMGRDVALGKISADRVKEFLKAIQASIIKEYESKRAEYSNNALEKLTEAEEKMYQELYEKEKEKTEQLTEKTEQLTKDNSALQKKLGENALALAEIPELQKQIEKDKEEMQKIAEKASKQFEQAMDIQKKTLSIREDFRQFLFPDGVPSMEMEKMGKTDVSAIDKRIAQIETDIKELLKWKNGAEPSTQNPISLTVESNLSEVTVERTEPKQIRINKDKAAGKIMYFAIELLNSGQPTVINTQIRSIALEHGVSFSNIEFNKAFAWLVSQNYLIKEGDGYRLPKNLPIKVAD